MKKVFAALLICLPLLITSCSCSQTGKNLNREDTGSQEGDPTGEPGEGGEQSPEENEKKVSELTEEEYKDFPTLYLKKLNKYKSYKAVTTGSTKASVSVLGIPIETTQSIDVTVIKGDYSYLINESHSSFVNTVHTAYFHNDEVVFKNLDSSYVKNTLSEYLNTYGTYPFDNAIEGYTVSEESIISITKNAEVSSPNSGFVIEFDPVKATNNVKIQMREFGGLDDYPTFSKIALSIIVQDDFTPVAISLESDYVAKKGMDSTCHQSYEVTFSNFDEEIACPGLEDVKDQFSK